MRVFVRMVDGVVSLSEHGQALAVARFPRIARKPHVVVRHGHYIGALRTSIDKDSARQAVGIPGSDVVVAYAGRIAPYKNVARLIDAFRALDRENIRLLVAGAPTSSELGASLGRAAGGDPRIDLSLEHVPDERLEQLIRAADLVVFPYRDILNSGSLLFALSLGRPVLVPAKGAVPEFARLVGSEWIRTYVDELDARVLADALDRLYTESEAALTARLARHFGWDAAGVQTGRFLLALGRAS
jgi:glycosyltransferase involved in cell wall biosynthesis